MEPIERSTSEVLEHHLASMAEKDIEAVMMDYDDEIVFVTAEGVKQGKSALREFFVNDFKNVFPKGSCFKIIDKHVFTQIAFITWMGESRFVKIPYGSDTFIVQHGRIVYQSVTACAAKEAKT